MSESTELAVIDVLPNEMAIRRPPEEVLAEATRAAKCLKTVLDGKAKKVVFNGERYLEEWRDVPGWPRYEISNRGRIRAKIRIHHAPNGYPTVQLSRDGNETKRLLVHCLVAEAFLGPRPQGKVVNHKDGNKANSSAANLEYVSRSENAQHAIQTGLLKHKAMFTPLDVAFIRELLKQKCYSRRQLADRYHVSYSTIADIERRRSYPSECY